MQTMLSIYLFGLSAIRESGLSLYRPFLLRRWLVQLSRCTAPVEARAHVVVPDVVEHVCGNAAAVYSVEQIHAVPSNGTLVARHNVWAHGSQIVEQRRRPPIERAPREVDPKGLKLHHFAPVEWHRMLAHGRADNYGYAPRRKRRVEPPRHAGVAGGRRAEGCPEAALDRASATSFSAAAVHEPTDFPDTFMPPDGRIDTSGWSNAATMRWPSLQRMGLPVQQTSNEPANERSIVRVVFFRYSRVACGLIA
eukprot:scaffold13997_cov72-Phaeocystis_antarctica.AAC.3